MLAQRGAARVACALEGDKIHPPCVQAGWAGGDNQHGARRAADRLLEGHRHEGSQRPVHAAWHGPCGLRSTHVLTCGAPQPSAAQRLATSPRCAVQQQRRRRPQLVRPGAPSPHDRRGHHRRGSCGRAAAELQPHWWPCWLREASPRKPTGSRSERDPPWFNSLVHRIGPYWVGRRGRRVHFQLRIAKSQGFWERLLYEVGSHRVMPPPRRLSSAPFTYPLQHPQTPARPRSTRSASATPRSSYTDALQHRAPALSTRDTAN